MDYENGANKPSEIVPGVWLGDMYTAADRNFFLAHNIGAVLNCTPDIPFYFSNEGVNYRRLNVNDSLQPVDLEKMRQQLPAAIKWMYYQHDDRYGPKRNLFVHCHLGIQRSPTAVVAYLYHTRKRNLSQCIRHVISRRPKAFFGGFSLHFLRPLSMVCST